MYVREKAQAGKATQTFSPCKFGLRWLDPEIKRLHAILIVFADC